MSTEAPTKILGIDPGSRITGFGIIEVSGNKCTHLVSEPIILQEEEFTLRIKELFLLLTQRIIQYQPQVVALEAVFMHKNAASALKLGQARGAALAAIGAQNLPVFEYSARKVKQAVVGFGGAEKNQIQHMVSLLLNLDAPPQVDAADALALALCHASSFSRYAAVVKVKSKKQVSSWRKYKKDQYIT